MVSNEPAVNADLVVIGGGIVGLATAYQLLRAHPDTRLVLVEKEDRLAAHQSGHNSGVVHAGIYYAPGSLKARLCRAGKAELEAFAAEHGIPLERCGKLVVAIDDGELARLDELRQRAAANEVPGLELVGPDRMREIEPHAAGVRALWSPSTGVIDYVRVCAALADEIRTAGGTIETGRAVTAIDAHGAQMRLATTHGELLTRDVIACAGLQSDRVARMSGERPAEQIIPFRGDYWLLTPDARQLVHGLLYPVPDPGFPFLGVHFTRRIDGEVWAGPNAVLAFAREGYRRRDIAPRDLTAVLASRRFLGLAARYWRMGSAEMLRDLSKRLFHRSLRRYLPELRLDQLAPGPSGVRAQAIDPDGALVDDFRLGGNGHVLHVRNAPSPAATASLAIGSMLAAEAARRFELR
jgi:(S)-2-hydroxyglutarate dehydrogenase